MVGNNNLPSVLFFPHKRASHIYTLTQALTPWLENFRRAFSPNLTNCS